ncbi:MAG: class I SAM-dependent methyltransferase [Thermoanaerobaculia bacterium]
MSEASEVERIRERYRRRHERGLDERDFGFSAYGFETAQEKRRALVGWMRAAKLAPLERIRVFEIGCGHGDDLLDLIRLGFAPENVFANELLDERAAVARHRLPAGVTVFTGDATHVDLGAGSFDVVYQSMVFSSILDDQFQRALASFMWRLVRPGGGVLWYDFVFNNPANADVRGVPLRRLPVLFPAARIQSWSVTLAPPVGRRLVNIHPRAYGVANLLPWVRTHRLCWLHKTSST